MIKIYNELLDRYGTQGWWPLLKHGYTKSSYEFELSKDEVLEIALGTILTQNTNFNNVQKALNNLSGFIDAKTILDMDITKLKELIKPAGYYNQKAEYIRAFCEFFIDLDGKTPTRDELLALKGIGKESADTIRLYGYKQNDFVVDAYTKRFFTHIGLIDERAKYDEVKNLVEHSLEKTIKDKKTLSRIYHEFHALIVEHAKNHYSKKPYGCDIKL
ncbi:MAG: endonuclease III domain-containing protein [Sulfurimonas sp.]